MRPEDMVQATQNHCRATWWWRRGHPGSHPLLHTLSGMQTPLAPTAGRPHELPRQVHKGTGHNSLPPAPWAVCLHSKPSGRLKSACFLSCHWGLHPVGGWRMGLKKLFVTPQIADRFLTSSRIRASLVPKIIICPPQSFDTPLGA